MLITQSQGSEMETHWRVVATVRYELHHQEAVNFLHALNFYLCIHATAVREHVESWTLLIASLKD